MPVNPAPPASPKTPARKTPARSQGIRTAPDPGSARREGLSGYAQIASLFCVSRGWYADAGAIKAHGPRLIDETVKLAAENESVGKSIDYLCAAGPLTAVIAAALPLFMQIAANHERIDASAVSGVLPPDLLEKQVKNDVMRMQLALQQQADAETREMERMLDEMSNSQHPAAANVAT